MWSSSPRVRHPSESPRISGLTFNHICETAAYWDTPGSNLGRKMTAMPEVFRGFDIRRMRSQYFEAVQAHFLSHPSWLTIGFLSYLVPRYITFIHDTTSCTSHFIAGWKMRPTPYKIASPFCGIQIMENDLHISQYTKYIPQNNLHTCYYVKWLSWIEVSVFTDFMTWMQFPEFGTLKFWRIGDSFSARQ
jgi:hypothetical protein